MIEVRRLTEDGLMVLVDGDESMGKFKELVQRATNLWPDASPEIKEFADAVTNSDWHPKPLQNYKSQDTSIKHKRN
jgi:hypothetical protein